MTSPFYRDYEAYASSIQDADVQLTLTRLVDANWRVTGAFADRIHVQSGIEGSGSIAEGAARRDGMIAYLTVDRGKTLVNGTPLDDREDVFLIDAGAEFTIATLTPHDWWSVFVPLSMFDDGAGAPRLGLGPSTGRVAKIGCAAVRRLRRSVVDYLEADSTARVDAPSADDRLADDRRSAMRRLAEADLFDQFRAAVGASTVADDNPNRLTNDEIVRRALACYEAAEEAVPTVDDLAAAANVSVRTLRNAFHRRFHLSPRAFLRLRRLGFARDALRNAGDPSTTVATVAVACGFWQLGRFAGDYRRQFGEAPSDTLRRGIGGR